LLIRRAIKKIPLSNREQPSSSRRERYCRYRLLSRTLIRSNRHEQVQRRKYVKYWKR